MRYISIPSTPKRMLKAGLTYPQAGVITTKPTTAPTQKPFSDICFFAFNDISSMTQKIPDVHAAMLEQIIAFAALELMASSLPPTVSE